MHVANLVRKFKLLLTFRFILYFLLNVPFPLDIKDSIENYLHEKTIKIRNCSASIFKQDCQEFQGTVCWGGVIHFAFSLVFPRNISLNTGTCMKCLSTLNRFTDLC